MVNRVQWDSKDAVAGDAKPWTLTEVDPRTRQATHGVHRCASVGIPKRRTRPTVMPEASEWLVDPVPCCAQFSSSNTLYSALESGHPSDRSGRARSTRERTLPSCVRETPSRAFQADHPGVGDIRNPSRGPFGEQKARDSYPCSGQLASSGFVASRSAPLAILDFETWISFPSVNDLIITLDYGRQH